MDNPELSEKLYGIIDALISVRSNRGSDSGVGEKSEDKNTRINITRRKYWEKNTTRFLGKEKIEK